ncbi:MAG: SdrD B-like domain-containing protein [Chloroflexota bacterium]
MLSGRVFEDANYAGGPGTAFGGGDMLLPGVTVELYDSGGAFIVSTTTNASGIYTFGVFPSTTYVVRVVSASIGDADTPPAAGFNLGFTSALAEQTYESNGVTGNGGAFAFGGNDRTVDDTATVPGAGVGDTNVMVNVGAISIIGVDFGFSYMPLVNTNNSGQGSLRQVISNANAIIGADTVRFELTGAAIYTIQPLTALPIITDPLTIDGTTQAGFGGAPIIELDGAAGSIGLEIRAGSSTVRGLVINGFDEGILLDTNGNNVVQGNYIGTNVAGTGDLGNLNNGILIQDSANNTIGGTTAAQRNLISGNDGDGIRITGPTSDGNTVQGNYIGTDESGALDVGNSGDGIRIRDGADNNLIGGTTGTTVGGPCTGACNIIAFNDDGVEVDNAVQNTIQRNSFFSNTGLGIDLIPNDVTANDNGDPDAGANDLLNFPVIYTVNLAGGPWGGFLTITGEARPGTVVEFYVADNAPSGNGEGRTFITFVDTGITQGTTDTTARQFSLAPFLTAAVNAGDEITAIAIDANGNTSEFSLNKTVP